MLWYSAVDIILLRLQLPVELRRIILDDYFPFLQKETILLTPSDLLELTDPHFRWRHWPNTYYGKNFVAGIFFMSLAICNFERQIVVSICGNYDLFPYLTFETKEITEQSAPKITEKIVAWYRKQIVHGADKEELNSKFRNMYLQLFKQLS